VGIHDGAREFRLQMEGPLSGPAVNEAESCWQTAASTIEDRGFVVDLREMTGVDDSGRRLLRRMSQAGARFLTRGETRHRRSLKELFAALACLLLTWGREDTAD
jgi:hypothetical protein